MSARSRASRLLALVACASLVACGGDTSTTAQATPSPTIQASTPAAAEAVTPSADAGHSYRHHRHHRHRRSGYESPEPPALAPNSTAYPCDDAKFVAVQGEFASGALEGDQLVDVCGPVTRVLAARTTRSGLHGYFFVRVAAGDEIEVVSDLGRMNAPAWPWVRVGDTATVRGRYYFDSATSQGIDWTHRGASASWPSPGYVVIGGTEYQ